MIIKEELMRGMYHSGVDGRRISSEEWNKIPPEPISWGAQQRKQRLKLLGLREISNYSLASRCPRKLVGKRCLGEECWCQVELGMTINDHSAMYRRSDGERVVFWEPYQIHGSDLVKVISAADADGIAVCVHGSSPYYPGRTLVVEFQAKL